MKRWTTLAPMVVVSICCFWQISCRKSNLSSSTGPDSARAIVLPVVGQQVVEAENQFSMNLFHALLSRDSLNGNVMISPFSVYIDLGMVDNGAAGTTQDSIDQALSLGRLSLTDLNSTVAALSTQLPRADAQVTLSVANSVWLNQSLTFIPSFEQTVETSYNAKVSSLNFGDPSAAVTINDWVASQTQQIIKGIVAKTDASMAALLVNAVYFKGAWTYAFDPGATKNGPFTLGTGAVENTALMTTSKSGSFPFLSNDSLSMLELPYGGQHFSLFALLPGQSTNIHSLAAALTLANLAHWQSRLLNTNVVPYFPKFAFSYSIDNMQPELTALGMGIAFGNPDFSNMTQTPVAISQVIHKTAIAVDESGTVAAAVTATGLTETSLPEQWPVYFNHPFLFVIQEKTSGVILFIGVLNDPLAS
jgi:serine protease inhibitor